MRYHPLNSDSDRWVDFPFRAGDIVVSAPPKCGTTWTQTICALLVLQTPTLPAALHDLSPWLECRFQTRKDVVDRLEAQTHRRVIKSHTPLDGLPHRSDVTYVCVGRDPRDVAVSADHHSSNADQRQIIAKLRATAAVEGWQADLQDPVPRDRAPADAVERFWRWVDDEAPLATSGWGLRFTLHHLETFRRADPDLDIVMLHYGDLQDDLEGEMRRLAERLDITVPESRWPDLVAAASFDAMKAEAHTFAPDPDVWKDDVSFFHSGTSGQWRELLDDSGLERYRARVASLSTAELAAWAHRPWP